MFQGLMACEASYFLLQYSQYMETMIRCFQKPTYTKEIEGELR